MIPSKAIQAIHAAICEEAFEDHMDPEWPGRCVKAAQATYPIIAAQAWDEGRKHGAQYPYGKRGLAADDNPYRKPPRAAQ